jgi:hypothetical protein
VEKPVRIVENAHAFADSSQEPYPICVSLLTEEKRILYSLTLSEAEALREDLAELLYILGDK